MAKILIIDDDPKIGVFLSDILESLGHTPTAAQTLKEGRKLAFADNHDILLLDLDLPDGNGLTLFPDILKCPSNPEVIIITGTGDIQGAKVAFKYGAWDYIQKPFTIEEVSLPITRALEYRREKKTGKEPVSLQRTGIIGSSNAIQYSLDDVAKASVTSASVLITGETGTGKELFARAIHENSKRAAAGFIAVNCGAIPETLAEESFFGHEKGAFTGADARRDGLIRQADGGTLFLDEIGDLALVIQKSLLRVLQEKKVRPIGGKEIPVDFRLVAATNRDLLQMVKENRFREDLLYRIRAIEIKLPPLRCRDQDVQEIALHKIHQICGQYGTGVKGISPEFMKILTTYEWPGNARELINVLEFALASAGADPTLHPKHLPPEYRTTLLKSGSQPPAGQGPVGQDFPEAEGDLPKLFEYRARTERQYFQALVQKARGNREKACRLAGISQARLYSILKKHNLSL